MAEPPVLAPPPAMVEPPVLAPPPVMAEPPAMIQNSVEIVDYQEVRYVNDENINQINTL